MKTRLVILLLVCITNSVIAVDSPKQITKISRKQFDVPKEIVAFVSRLVEANPDVSTKYNKLIAMAKEEAGGRLAVGAFVPIEWLVPDFHAEFSDSGGTRDGEYIYLVQQQLRSGFHRGYSVDDNVVARVRAKLHEDHTPNPDKRGDFVLNSTTLELTFEGFVDVTLNPK